MRITVNPTTGHEEVILFKSELKRLKQAEMILGSLKRHQPNSKQYGDAHAAVAVVNGMWSQGEDEDGEIQTKQDQT